MSTELQYTLYHELGHYIVARTLGEVVDGIRIEIYEGTETCHLSLFAVMGGRRVAEGVVRRTIAASGLAAEELLGEPSGGARMEAQEATSDDLATARSIISRHARWIHTQAEILARTAHVEVDGRLRTTTMTWAMFEDSTERLKTLILEIMGWPVEDVVDNEVT